MSYRSLYSARSATKRVFVGLAAVVAGATALLVSTRAHAADPTIIAHPDEHLHYRVEVEPHLALAFPGPFSDNTVGPGARVNLVLFENGFIRDINNNVAIGFGGDFLFGRDASLYLPIDLQWNFFLLKELAVYGEGGLGVVIGGRDAVVPIVEAGGKLFITDRIALNLRLGFPEVTFGASFHL